MTPNRLSFDAAPALQLGTTALVFNSLLRLLTLCITLSLPLLGPALADPGAATTLPRILAARVTNTPERARLILDLSAPTKFAVVTEAEPNRIAVDVAVSAVGFTQAPAPAGSGLVTSYSVSLADAGRGRATLSLSGPAQVQQAYVLDAFADQPARLVIDLIPDSAENFAKRAAADAAAVTTGGAAMADKSTPPGQSEVTPEGTAAPTGGEMPEKAPMSAQAQGGPASAAPTAAAGANPPVAEASHPKPLIVLDPGHGGIDSGARAPNGLMEKNIVLAFALKLQKLLVATGRFDVALTRTTDTYLTLEQRVQLARENKADLFISLHADSFSQPEIHGASLYTRDEQATDELDKVLADNENKFDIVSGFAVPKMTPQIIDVLLDLMRRQMRKQSYMAAESIVHELQPSVELRRFPIRQANFFVLQAPDVPSMLIELGFMSNSDDIRNLTDPAWQDRVAAALARGISAYFDETGKPTS